LTQPWEEGREVILDLANRGQMVGEEAVIPGSTRLNGCVALSAGKAVRVSREVLAICLREDPALAQTMLVTSYRRARAVSTRLEEMTVGSVRSRVARVLLRLSEEQGLDDARGRFVPVPLRRGDLADMVACRVETVIRVMTDWQRRLVIDTQREGFVILSLKELKHDAIDA
jgi:CRP/FNR family transcriptional regulator